MSEFSDHLRRCRETAGYASPREFYRSAGGRAALRCTYAQYRNIEAGRCTPKPKIMHALVALLEVWKDPERAAAFCKAYLASQFGRGEFLDFLLRSLGPKPVTPGSASSPLRKAMKTAVDSRAKPLSVEQSRMIRSTPAHYWIFQVLASDSRSWSPERIAGALSLPQAQVNRALGDLCGLGLAERKEGGVYGSPYRDRLAIHERPARGGFEALDFIPAQRKNWDFMAKRHGKTLFHQYILIRASEAEVKGYLPYLTHSVHGLEIYETLDRGPDTGFILAEATVRRLMPF